MVTTAAVTDDVYLDYPANILLSYHYFKRHDMHAYARGGLAIIGDSGAFSAASVGVTIDRDDFYAWVDRNRSALHWAASLDVIGDERASWSNWSTAPRHLKLVPTVHYGADPRALDRYAERGCTLIGLGGMVPHSSDPARLMRWCLSMMRYARDQWPDVRFHGWGVTHQNLMMNLPWWSLDSSGFGSGYRYARLRLFDPRTGRFRQISIVGRSTRETAQHHRFLRDVYGVSWRAFEEPPTLGYGARTIVRLAVRSAQLCGQFLQRRHHVAAPSGFVGEGPQVSIVFGSTSYPRLVTNGEP